MTEPAAAAWIGSLLFAFVSLFAGCRAATERAPSARGVSAPPSILLVTLDTTRADAIGPDAFGVETPSFDALARRGMRFRQAYATVPETLPSHASMLTGLYPAGHGVHENARTLPGGHPLLAERLRQAGYRTAAFVSSFVLARRFGLARGFDLYDDELPAEPAERTAKETTDRAIAYLEQPVSQPLLLWVHYYDPHHPYTPPEPFRSRYSTSPYLGEVAAMDAELGRLVRAFEGRARGPVAIVVASDHGEGLGDHGESQHGKLVYQATMHVPLLVAGPGVAPGASDAPVSARRVFHTILDFAGLEAADSLRVAKNEIVLGEGMKPYLAYGWQPQALAVEERLKVIQAGRPEVYDVVADPAETRDLAGTLELSRPLRTALREYPVPSLAPPPPADRLGEEERRQLAALGYVSASAAPVIRKDAPRPADMSRLFEVLDEASTLFVREEYARVIPLLRRILQQDPHNLDAALRLATAHSALGQGALAEKTFDKAADIAPGSPDVRIYRALHLARGSQWPRAVPLLEQVVAEAPDRLPALEALAQLRERQGRAAEALELWRKIHELRRATPAELVHTGELAMSVGQTGPALDAFEKARAAQGTAFAHDLELGVLYLAARRYPDARDALDRVAASHPAYAMALFKRAQVSVLLNEPERAARIERARQHADATTRGLIARERLFKAGGGS
ncbi:MAG TPA: sulfatase-like hydrolase/transferase [Vicinamibacteria bacterium]|nr:sulfatase-like hydrolase/transferase [Vicinamibacteria bacterium]